MDMSLSKLRELVMDRDKLPVTHFTKDRSLGTAAGEALLQVRDTEISLKY